MNNTVINVKTEKEVKESAKRVAKDLGLSLSAVINAYLRQFVRNRAVYFSSAPTMTAELESLLGGIEYDIQRGGNVSGPITSKKELEKFLASL